MKTVDRDGGANGGKREGASLSVVLCLAVILLVVSFLLFAFVVVGALLKVDFGDLIKYLTSAAALSAAVLFLIEYAGRITRFRGKMDVLELREHSAVESYRIMCQSQEGTRRERHEMRHHMVLLNEMLAHGQTERAQEYVRFLVDRIDSIPSGTYCDNMVINAIAGHYLNSAKSKRIAVSADIRASESTVLRDEELCVLLTNMLENAEEACTLMSEDADRFIRFKFRSSEDHLSIVCENSTSEPVAFDRDGAVVTTKDDAAHHGYGIAAMRRIVEKHGGEFTVACSDGTFTVKAVI